MVNRLKRILCYLSSKWAIYILKKQLKDSLSILKNNIYSWPTSIYKSHSILENGHFKNVQK